MQNICFNINNKLFEFKIVKNNYPNFIEDNFDIIKEENSYVFRRTLKNIGNSNYNLYESKITLEGVLANDISKDFYYTPENIRLYGLYSIPVDFDRTCTKTEYNKKFNLNESTIYADPETLCERILASPYQPFPGVLIGNYDIKEGIVFGTLKQDYYYHNLVLRHENNKLIIDIYSSFKSIEYKVLNPGDETTDEFSIFENENSHDINHIFDNYISKLKVVLKNNYGKSNINRHTLLWDSWNDGIYRDINEEMLLEEAKAYKKYFKNAEWFEVDDGYSTYIEKDVDLDAHGIGVPYEENGIDKNKFPNGLKYFTDKIREIGLKPSVWVGGLCPKKTQIYNDHKEWFFDFDYRVNFSSPLDISINDARKYMEKSIKTFVEDYGFDGIKHDFWSYAFEEKHDVLKNKDKSGYEYRKYWTKYIRSLLPEYGYVQTGCDICIGNPFLGEYFNNFRFGIDVGGGRFSNILTTYRWALGIMSTHAGSLFIPNSDSIGLLPNLNDTDFMFVVNMQIVTRSIVEICGRFSKVDENNKRLKILRKACEYLNNGEDVYYPNFDYLNSNGILPKIIMINSEFDTGSKDFKTVGLFNTDEKDIEIKLNLKDIGLNSKHIIYDVWEDEKYEDDEIKYVLSPHGSKLLKIKI